MIYRVRTGFTLAELLIVVAIVAALAAILFPVFAGILGRQENICLANEEKIGTATLMYCQDYDEYMPLGMNGNVGGYYEDVGWAGLIYPYLNSIKPLRCPNDTALVSYAINSNFVQPGAYFEQSAVVCNLGSFPDPGVTVMYCEVANSLPNGYTVPGGWFTWNAADIKQNIDLVSPAAYGVGEPYGWSNNTAENPYGVPWYGVTYATGVMDSVGANTTFASVSGNWAGASGSLYSTRHYGGSNFVLCDGHAKWFRGDKVSAGYGATPAELATWFAGRQIHGQLEDACGGYNMSVPVEYIGQAQSANYCGHPQITFDPF